MLTGLAWISVDLFNAQFDQGARGFTGRDSGGWKQGVESFT